MSGAVMKNHTEILRRAKQAWNSSPTRDSTDQPSTSPPVEEPTPLVSSSVPSDRRRRLGARALLNSQAFSSTQDLTEEDVIGTLDAARVKPLPADGSPRLEVDSRRSFRQSPQVSRHKSTDPDTTELSTKRNDIKYTYRAQPFRVQRTPSILINDCADTIGTVSISRPPDCDSPPMGFNNQKGISLLHKNHVSLDGDRYLMAPNGPSGIPFNSEHRGGGGGEASTLINYLPTDLRSLSPTPPSSRQDSLDLDPDRPRRCSLQTQSNSSGREINRANSTDEVFGGQCSSCASVEQLYRTGSNASQYRCPHMEPRASTSIGCYGRAQISSTSSNGSDAKGSVSTSSSMHGFNSRRSRSRSSSKYLNRPTRLINKVASQKTGDGYICLNQYKLMEDIGQGSYGIVKLAYSQEDNSHYAMKILDKKKIMKKFAFFRRPPPRKGKPQMQLPDPLQQVYREIAILKKLNHPNVVKLVEVLDDPSDDFLYMAFEYMEKGCVLDIPTTEPLLESQAWLYFRDVVLGLEYLHYQKVVHRDIKPSNLLISDDGHVKIADFGVSSEFQGLDALLKGTAGTPAFMAPEALIENSQRLYSGKAQDIWSLGITLYSFVYGNVPFCDNYVIALHKKIKNDVLEFPPKPTVSEDFKAVVTEMLCKDPDVRITLSELKEHRFVTRHGLEPLESISENCDLITVTEEEVQNSVRVVPKIDTLILIKVMGQRKRFGNPFRPNSGGYTTLNPELPAPALRQGKLSRIATTARSVYQKSHSLQHDSLQRSDSVVTNPSRWN